ncbi:hypothetical protein D3C72_2000130 [compost metagenome]
MSTQVPNKAPVAPPIVKSGASVPPDVPLPKAIAQDRNLKKHKLSIKARVAFPESMLMMFSYPTPRVWGAKYPIIPTARPPIAGHHTQCIGSFSKVSSIQYTTLVRPNDINPIRIPIPL